MTTTFTRTMRRSFAVGAVMGAAAVGALLPTAAIASDVTTSLPSAQVESRAEGAAMLGGWVGGGILLLGTSVIVATASVRRGSVVDPAAALADA